MPWAVSVHTKLDIVDHEVSQILQKTGLIVGFALLVMIIISSIVITHRKVSQID